MKMSFGPKCNLEMISRSSRVLILEGVYMASFRPKRGGNESPTSIEFGQSVYMMAGVSAEPSSSVLAAEALPFVSAASAM